MTEDSVVEIDKDHLDRECLRLPRDYLQAAQEAADAKHQESLAKAELDVVESDVQKELRDLAAKSGEKVTEASIKASICAHPKFRKAQRRLIEYKHRQEMAQAVVWALEHKKRSLTLLVDLHGMGYFSSPRISAEGREAVEEMTKRRVRRREQE